MTARRRLSAVPDAPRRGVALIRVSKVGGREDLASPEIQRVAIDDYARAHGIDVVEWVEALDESASRAKSAWWPRLDQAVAQVEAGQRDVVLVWKVSRAARHRRNWAVAVDRIEVAGGTIESATEGLDTTTSTGRLARGVLAELAAWESEVKAEQWKEAQARRRRRGLPHNGGPRFGYTYSKQDGYQPCPDTGPLLAALYRRYAAGEGFQVLAAWLNATGVPTMRGGRWAVQTLLRQLDSGFAAGLLHVHSTGELLPGAHKPLITEKEWQAYLRRRQDQRKMPARARAPRYVLTGLAKCGQPGCGAAMSAMTTPRGPGYMYRCTAHMSSRTCPGIWISRARLEAAVKEWIDEQAADIDRLAATKVARRAAAATARADVGRLRREADRLRQALARLTVDLATGLVPASAYAGARDELEQRQAEVAAALEVAERDAAAMVVPSAPLIKGLARDWDTLPVARRRDMLALLIERVEVVPAKPRAVVRVLPRV